MGSKQVCQAAALTMMLTAVAALRQYVQRVPNGNNILNPCDGTLWLGLGHVSPTGGGPNTQFGKDFAANNHTWTVALCQTDSDGDGKTNGFELGNPTCTWQLGDGTDGLKPVEGHPGICEPLHLCPNNWFSCSPDFTLPPAPVGK